jgi:hypothetical protein
MLVRFKDLTATGCRTMAACFGAWSRNLLDGQIFCFVIPSMLVASGVTN